MSNLASKATAEPCVSEPAGSPAVEVVMWRDDVNQLPVVRDGRFEGVLARSHVLRLLQTRAELQM
jgi:hypothetical protein